MGSKEEHEALLKQLASFTPLELKGGEMKEVRTIGGEPVPTRLAQLATLCQWSEGRLTQELLALFIKYYTGNIKQTLRIMRHDGYTPLPDLEYFRWLASLPEFSDLLQRRLLETDADIDTVGIAFRRELQVWWTELLRDTEIVTDAQGNQRPAVSIAEKLRAADYLAKAQGMFVDRKELKGHLTLASLVEDEKPNSLDSLEGED